jgi:hypothetical protein
MELLIEPNHFIVLASNKQEFNVRYGFTPFGEYSTQLDNGGETITFVSTPNDTVFSISYSDQAPWPESPDGEGYSLVPTEANPTNDQNDPANWRASYSIHGSPGSDDIPTSVEDEKRLPTSIELFQNYPNPFNPETKIRYTLNSTSKVRLSVYDILGREIAVPINRVQNAGRYEVTFSGTGLASGVYFYRLNTENGVITRKMLLLR